MALSSDPTINLGQFIVNAQHPLLQQSPEKIPNMVEIMQNVFGAGVPLFGNNNKIAEMTTLVSSGSTSPRNDSPNSDEQTHDTPILGQNKEPRNYRLEPWHECFTTTSHAEFEALIYSVYVLQREDKKLDGYEYYECLNRLQSKCRYRVRAKKMNEFFIVEEKGAHNHAMEPVGTAGTHAGLPKTLREIVDLSFREDWAHGQRQAALDEEVKRLGLPHNPRLSRQVDNRIAYLRRVKNLSEMRKLQEQIPGAIPAQTTLPTSANPQQNEENTNGSDDLLRIMMQLANGNQEAVQDPTRLLQLMISNGMSLPLGQIDGIEKENDQTTVESDDSNENRDESEFKPESHSNCSSPNGLLAESSEEN